MDHFGLIHILIFSIFEASFQPESSFRVILLSISMFFPILKGSNIHVILSHQLSFTLINAMLNHPFIILPLSLHEEIPTFLTHVKAPCKFRVILEVYLDPMAVFAAEIMLTVVHLVVEIVDDAFIIVRAGLRLASEVYAVFVFFYHWVREVDVEL